MTKLMSGLTLVLLLLSVGCSSQNDPVQSDADISGTIVEVNEQTNQILIEQDKTDNPDHKDIWISKDEDSPTTSYGRENFDKQSLSHYFIFLDNVQQKNQICN